jgi:T4-like virus tail tube protein gp19
MGHTTRSFLPGHFLLELEGVPAGYVRNVQGGGAVAEVVQEKAGADHIVRKHIGGVRYDDIVLTYGAGLSKAFYEWVDRTASMQHDRHDGAVVVFDNSNKELSRLDWYGGLITHIEFPALDAASTDSFSMTIKITPERTQRGTGGGSQSVVAKAQKNWLTNDFRITINGLEDACKHVSRIESIALAPKAVKNYTGERRDYTVEPGVVELGNLVVTLAESHAKGFYDWFEDFAVKGNSSNEKNGSLESGSFFLKLDNLGIIAITGPSKEPGAMIRKIKAEMYCESIRFSAS